MFLYDVPNVVLTYLLTLPLLLRAIKFYGSSVGIYIYYAMIVVTVE